MPPGQPLFAQLHHRDRAVREAARRHVAQRVAAHGGDARAAAVELGISLRTVKRSMGSPGRGPAPLPAPPPALDSHAPGAPIRSAEGGSPLPDFAARYRRPLGDQDGGDEAPDPPLGDGAPPAPSLATSDPVQPGEPARGSEGAGKLPAAAAAAPAPAADPGTTAQAPTTPPPLAPPTEPAGPWPHHQPRAAPPPAERPGADAAPRRVAFVLHAHLPWVLGHGTWPHGEDWLAEAVAHCYLPLLGALRRLAAGGGRHLLALSVSPVLAAQLADPRLRPLVEGYLAHRREAARRLAGDHPLAVWWGEVYDGLARDWDGLGGDLLGALRELQATGAVELSTCAATHGYLPLLHRPEHVALQVRAARHNHERWFGRPPAGLWMPECAYRPQGPWEHPITGAREGFRPGNERFLEDAGLQWTVVDAHLLLDDEPLLPYPFGGVSSARQAAVPDPAEEGARLAIPVAARLQPHQIDATPLAALFREPHTAHQVWSRHGGYPGDPRYLDFHKRHAESGLRLWRVTDAGGDLGDKLAYHPADAVSAAREHARHFVELVASVPGLAGGVAVSPYDAELFGHWWFEGPVWLEEVLSRCASDPRVSCTTPSRELAAVPPRRRAELREGSWGEAGDHRVWANEGTAWMWRELRAAEEDVAAALAGGLDGPRARAALAQLLLLAASDWPFLVTAGAAADYAAERFRTHRDRLATLLAPPASGPGDAPLPTWAEEDLAELHIEPRWWHWEVTA